MIAPWAPAPYFERSRQQHPADPGRLPVRAHDEQREPPQPFAQQHDRDARETVGVLGDPGAAGVGGERAAQAHVNPGPVGRRRGRLMQPPSEILEGRCGQLSDGGHVRIGHRAQFGHRGHDRTRR